MSRSQRSQRSQPLSMMSQQTYPGVYLDQMIKKENDYKAGITENHQLGVTQAQSLCLGGQLETLIGDVSEYRDKLKVLSEKNIENERKVKAFIGALKNISNQQEEIQDYHEMLQESMEKELQRIHQSSVAFHQESMYLETCTALGEISEVQKDDELEVVQNESSSTNNLKCPISGALLEEPVRNKYCKHVYSKKHIMQHIRLRKRTCPVFGCSNDQLNESQLEADMATERLVRREQIRQEQERQQISQNAINFDDDEDEF